MAPLGGMTTGGFESWFRFSSRTASGSCFLEHHCWGAANQDQYFDLGFLGRTACFNASTIVNLFRKSIDFSSSAC